MSYISLLGFALSFGEQFSLIMSWYKEIQNYSSSLITTEFNNNPPQKNFHRDFYPNKEYLLRRHQDRYGFNKRTRICQKGLEIRLENQEIKRQKVEAEARIKRDFLYDNTKSKRWMKRHHYICPKSKASREI